LTTGNLILIKSQNNVVLPSVIKHKIKNYLKSWLVSHPKLFEIYRTGIFRTSTASVRIMPDFIIIGAMKSGTTSLHDYLIQHPNITAGKRKEAHFFSVNYYRGLRWYKANFPTIFNKVFSKILRKKFLTGEATPDYLFHPLSPQRVKQILPNVKILVIVRNPVDRAYSHYNYEKDSRNRETLTFEDALEKEEERLSGEKEKIIQDERYFSKNLMFFAYLARGIYVDQLKKWFKFFPRKQFLILKTENLERNPLNVCNTVFQFLDLPPSETKNLEKSNVGEYQMKTMKESTRKFLVDYFRPHNERLSNYLNMEFEWDR